MGSFVVVNSVQSAIIHEDGIKSLVIADDEKLGDRTAFDMRFDNGKHTPSAVRFEGLRIGIPAAVNNDPQVWLHNLLLTAI
jgi:hypothetical protein